MYRLVVVGVVLLLLVVLTEAGRAPPPPPSPSPSFSSLLRTSAASPTRASSPSRAPTPGSPSPPPTQIDPTVWPHRGYYVLRDDKVGWNVTRAMPCAQHTDYQPTTMRPTVVLLTHWDVPAGLYCDGIVLDLPFVRPLSSTTAPGVAHFFIWTGTAPPAGDWYTISGQIADSWGQPAPSWNNTWQPLRRLGVYRFQHLVLTGRLATSGMPGGQRYWIGVYVEQHLLGPNSVHWLAAPAASTPFSYVDVNGNYLLNRNLAQPQMTVTTAPQGTLFYANASLQALSATVMGLCHVTDPAFDLASATVLAQLGAPSWTPIDPSSPPPPPPSPTSGGWTIGTPSITVLPASSAPPPPQPTVSVPPSPSQPTTPVASPSPVPQPVPSQSPPISVAQQPSVSTILAQQQPSSSPTNNNTLITTPPPQQPLELLSASPVFIFGIALVALAIVILVVAVIVLIVVRRRRRQRGLGNFKDDKADERLVELEPIPTKAPLTTAIVVTSAASSDADDDDNPGSNVSLSEDGDGKPQQPIQDI